MLAVDTVLQERYRIVRPLGQGGMGAVYQAVDERLDKTVAIKEILLELENASNSNQKLLIKQAFKREANSLVKARHDAVPDVTDYFSDFEREFLVMEFVEGDDLTKMLQKRRMPFLLADVLPWIDQLLEALDYLHSLTPPIIHRDIKPQNLKLNEWNKIKLLDFGIAKSTDKSNTITQMTFIGATLNYSPIEQILRVIDPMFRELILLKHKEKAEKVLAQNTDVRCDIFALGATFYHLLTNYPPVDITKRTLETWEGKEDPLPEPVKLNPELPTSISNWLIKAMAIDRDNRFSSAIEMRKSLQKIIIAEEQRKKEEELALKIKEDKLRKYREEKEEKKRENQEKKLMHARTERLIDLPDLSDLKKEGFSASSSPPPAEKNDELHSELQATEAFSSFDIPVSGNHPNETFSASENASTDYKLTDTSISLVDTAEKLPEISYEENKTKSNAHQTEFTVSTEVQSAGNSVNNSQKILVFSIIGVLAFMIFGGVAGVAVWVNYSGASDRNGAASESSNTSFVETPEITPSAEANADTTESNLNENTETVSGTPESIETPVTVKENKPTSKPTSQPVSTPAVRKTPTPVPKSTPVIRTPTPKPVKPTPKPKKLSDDCIYNGKC